MVGKHAVEVGRLRTLLSATFVGARELFVFAAVGIAAPIAVLVFLPSLTDAGTAMEDASTCEAAARDCLEPVAAELVSPTSNPTWRLRTETGNQVLLAFPSAESLPSSEPPLHVLSWNGDPVALLQADGKVVGGLDWGRLYGVSEQTLLMAPLWPLLVIALGWLLLRRHRAKLTLLTIVATGAAAAGPLAYAGTRLFGYRGLVAGCLVPVGLAFLVAGVTLAVMRIRQRGNPVRRSEAPAPRVPEQRHEMVDDPQELAEA